MLIVGVLFLILFGPSKLPSMARDLGRFVAEARRSVDEFKAELAAGGDKDGDKVEDDARSKTSLKKRDR